MTGGHRGINTQPLQKADESDLDCAECGLRHEGVRERLHLLFLLFRGEGRRRINTRRKRVRQGAVENAIGSFEFVAKFREVDGEIAHHTWILRTLPRKQEGDLSRLLTGRRQMDSRFCQSVLPGGNDFLHANQFRFQIIEGGGDQCETDSARSAQVRAAANCRPDSRQSHGSGFHQRRHGGG